MPLAPTRNRMKVTCPCCDTQHTIERGDEIPTVQCSSPGCPVLLCPCCPSFHCDGCGQAFCMEHKIEIEPADYDCTCVRLDVDYYDNSGCYSCNSDIRPRPDRFCAACLEESEAAEWPHIEKLEPVAAIVAVPKIPEWVA
jgi:hypothetical protein